MRYKDKEWLKRQYQNSTQSEIAERCGVSRATIARWMGKHDIETRSTGVAQADGEYKDKEWLRQKYVVEERSMKDIGDEFGVSKETIKYWLKKHGISIRNHTEAANIRASKQPHTVPNGRHRSIHANILTHKDKGYERIQCGVAKVQVSHHRLLATLLVDELSELEGKHVHHKDGIPWLNYPGGLEVLTPKEHKARHV